MAKRDIPQGFVYDKQTRGAVNPKTGERISRRQLEAPRIREELGLPATSKVAAFEAKARARAQQLYKLPRRLKVKNFPAQRRYRFHTYSEMLRGLNLLAPNSIVYVRVLGRNPFPLHRDSPKFRRRGYAAYFLRWITPTQGKFLAGDAPRVEPLMRRRLEAMWDIRAFDIVVTGEA